MIKYYVCSANDISVMYREGNFFRLPLGKGLHKSSQTCKPLQQNRLPRVLQCASYIYIFILTVFVYAVGEWVSICLEPCVFVLDF